jgi:hypothetical protein
VLSQYRPPFAQEKGFLTTVSPTLTLLVDTIKSVNEKVNEQDKSGQAALSPHQKALSDQAAILVETTEQGNLIALDMAKLRSASDEQEACNILVTGNKLNKDKEATKKCLTELFREAGVENLEEHINKAIQI